MVLFKMKSSFVGVPLNQPETETLKTEQLEEKHAVKISKKSKTILS